MSLKDMCKESVLDEAKQSNSIGISQFIRSFTFINYWMVMLPAFWSSGCEQFDRYSKHSSKNVAFSINKHKNLRSRFPQLFSGYSTIQ